VRILTLPSRVRGAASRRFPQARFSLRRRDAGKSARHKQQCSCFAVLIGLLAAASLPLQAKDRWIDLNIGPFHVDTDANASDARDALVNLEQLRWVLGGMLESKNLQATWPFRILITPSAQGAAPDFVVRHGEYVLAVAPNGSIPLDRVAKLFLDANTSRLPSEVEAGLPQLFAGLQARGSRVTIGASPAHPDLALARMHLFATKPEYAGRFNVFMNNLRGGSRLLVAEANAFGKDSKALEKEAAEHLSSGAAQPVTISARPLNPKRDLGEHSIDATLADLYLAGARLDTDLKSADASYKAAVEAGHAALGQEGLALVVTHEGGNPEEYLKASIASGSTSPWVYVEAAKNRPANEAIPLLKKAAELNPRWWIPVHEQSKFAIKPAEKEALLEHAAKLNPRSAALWQELAELQSKDGHGLLAQNSWVRAEDAADTPAERAKIHERAGSLVDQRLDAEEAARRQIAEDARVEQERLRDRQKAKIQAAEQRANKANGGTEDDLKNVVPWFTAQDPSVEGELTRVECEDRRAKIWVKPRGARVLVLLVTNPATVSIDESRTPFPCGIQHPPRKLSLTYRPRNDVQLGTAGDVTAIHFE
jgi:hypothetical protein